MKLWKIWAFWKSEGNELIFGQLLITQQRFQKKRRRQSFLRKNFSQNHDFCSKTSDSSSIELYKHETQASEKIPKNGFKAVSNAPPVSYLTAVSLYIFRIKAKNRSRKGNLRVLGSLRKRIETSLLSWASFFQKLFWRKRRMKNLTPTSSSSNLAVQEKDGFFIQKFWIFPEW